jgi:ribonuclease P protein component
LGACGTTEIRVVRLKRRREFLAVAGTRCRWVAPAFVLQAGPRARADEIGIGFTASRRLGKAVARNRARRRLRAAARALLPGAARAGYDYVIVARPAILTCSFETLLTDLAKAFARVIRRRSPGGTRPVDAEAPPPARSPG